jgi:hypothetical protein
MVNGKVVGGPTILALMIISFQDVLPAEHYRLEWDVHVGKETYNRGPGVVGGDGSKISTIHIGD